MYLQARLPVGVPKCFAGLLTFAAGLFLPFSAAPATALECSGTPRTVHGTVYCDNKFTLWVNGLEVAIDPIEFTPHQAVRVAFGVGWQVEPDVCYSV